jgi:hypothetical protein
MVKPGVPPNAGFFFSEKPIRGETPVAKPLRKREQKHKSFQGDQLPLKRENFIIIGIGLLVIACGYLAMLEGSVEGFLPLVVSPILLVSGYCVLIPLGILYRKSMFKRAVEAPPESQAKQT